MSNPDFSVGGKITRGLLPALFVSVLFACSPSDQSEDAGPATADIAGRTPGDDALRLPEEVHLTNVRQLTFGGQNAEAYFSFDGQRLTFQATPREGQCDQIYTMDLSGGNVELLSTGEGRTTCSYFYPAGDKILYSSTHHHSAECPAPPDFSRGYVWPVSATYDVWVQNLSDGSLSQLTDQPGYDAEATFSPTGDRIVFTSVRDGDLDLYSMNPDGTDVVRLTDRLGYDGGAFYSPDGSQIVWRAHYPEDDEAVSDYTALLAEELIRPSALELWVMNADGSNKRQITSNGAANFGPFWHPSGEKIIYSSNQADPSGRDFDLFMVDLDGSDNQRITFTEEFDGFPVFSPDGTQLVWGSNRYNEIDGETNVFIADWVENPGHE